MSSGRILCLDDEHDAFAAATAARARGPWHGLAVLFWSSPEARARLAEAAGVPASAVHGLEGLGLSHEAMLAEVYAVAHACAEGSPAHRGARVLQAWENVLADTLQHWVVAGVALPALEAHGDELVFAGAGPSARAFATRARVTGSRARVTVTEAAGAAPRDAAPSGRSSAGGSWRRLAAKYVALVREARRDGDTGRLLWGPIERFDECYDVRARLPSFPVRRRGTATTPGGEWIYASYLNYARILARHGVTSPQWIVNGYSPIGGIPAGARATRLWRFGGAGRTADRRRLAHDLAAHVRGSRQAVRGVPLGEILEVDDRVRYLVDRVAPRGLAEIDLAHAFFEAARPARLWLANQWGSEGLLAQVARAHGVPVVQVQHGTLEQYYRFAPLYTDELRVWGEFWRGEVAAAERARVQVVNPGIAMPQAAGARPTGGTGAAAGRRLTFFTGPLANVRLANAAVAEWEIVTLLERLRAGGYEVAVRVHPADRIASWEAAWRRHAGRAPEGIRFEKGTPLDDTLAHTDGALMLMSTTFLNCLAAGIPVTVLGWYPHTTRRALEAAGGMRFPASLAAANDSAGDTAPVATAGLQRFLA